MTLAVSDKPMSVPSSIVHEYVEVLEDVIANEGIDVQAQEIGNGIGGTHGQSFCVVVLGIVLLNHLGYCHGGKFEMCYNVVVFHNETELLSIEEDF